MTALLVHQAALGDFVLTWPLLRALRQRYARIAVAAPAAHAALARAVLGEGIDPVDIDHLDFTRLHADGGAGAVSEPMRRRWREATCIISFVSDGNDAWARSARRLAPHAQHCFVSARPPADWHEHVTLWHRTQLAQQGLILPAVEAPASMVRRSGPILTHPGSGGRDKCWPAARFAALIDRLHAAGHAVRVVLGEAEAERWPNEMLGDWQARYGAEVLTTLTALREALAAASSYIGNDSGPTHLAAQMGLTTLALFGPTDPRVWAPLGPAVTVLAPPRPAAMTWLDPERVADRALAGRGAAR